MSSERRTIVFFPEGAFGPTNNCVGIGDALKKRGHRVVFIIEESFAGTLEAKGFEEAHMRLSPPPEVEEVPGQFWKDFIRDTAPEFRKPTIEQLEGFFRPTWRAIVEGAKYANPRLLEIIDELRPHVVAEDNVQCFPALVTSGVPWVRIVSCNPLELKDPDLPPVFSGYPSNDRSGWGEFWREYDRVLGPMIAEFNEFVIENGAPPLSEREFIHESPWLNLYLYPGVADYQRSKPLSPTWHRLDSSVRATDAPFEIPDYLRGGTGQLVYLSLGSLGSADVELMQRLVDLLAKTDVRVIVSKGPQHDLITLADNVYGDEFLPQTSVLPQVDLVITHGGNNTVTECFYFGKPMVVLPLFWDQYDNAQRVNELGLGVRLSTYAFDDRELTDAIDRLAGDEALSARMRKISTKLQAKPGTVKAADLIERLARDGQPVTR